MGEIKMSSFLFGIPANCIDGNTTNGKMCHTAGKEYYPWITLVIPQSIVRNVRITNRQDCCGDRMKNMKIWVGKKYPSTTRSEYTGGALLGTFEGPGTNGQVVDITSKTKVEGTHVVVQMETDYINLYEIEVFGELVPDSEIKPLDAKMSSVHGNSPAANCIDSSATNGKMCHTAGKESYPWVTLVIPRSIVHKIRITNRNSHGDRMKNMKIWVGKEFPSTTKVEYTGGALLGTFKGPGTNGQVVEITSNTEVEGTHVVVQMHTSGVVLNLAEIEIFGEPVPD